MTETETQPTNRRPHARTSTFPEVLRAVADALSEPGADLAYPGVCYSSMLGQGQIVGMGMSELWTWTRLLDDVLGIDVRRPRYTKPDSDTVLVEVTGYLRGAHVVLAMERPLPKIKVTGKPREITVDELADILGVDREAAPAGSAVA